MSDHHPLFVYGSLKQGEIAHGLFSGFVAESSPGAAYGAKLFVRDGYPFMDVDPDRWGLNSFVEGSVLFAREGMELQLSRGALLYENSDFYSLVETEVLVGETVIMAESFTGKSPKRRDVESLIDPWDSRKNPLFVHAFPQVGIELHEVLPNYESV